MNITLYCKISLLEIKWNITKPYINKCEDRAICAGCHILSEPYGIVYEAFNIKTNKRYIGKTTKTLKERIYKHYKEHSNTYFHNTLHAYKKSNFRWTILKYCSSEDELNYMEKKYIELYKTNVHRYGYLYGYNLTDGGEGIAGMRRSEVTKQKLRDANLGVKSPKYGKPLSLKTKSKISKSNTGKKHSKETKEKMSIAAKSRPKRHYSEITRAKMSELNIGKQNPSYRHDISNEQIENLIQEGLSYRKIALQLNCSDTIIKHRIKKGWIKTNV